MLAVMIKRHLAPGMESTYEEFSRKIIQAAVPAIISVDLTVVEVVHIIVMD